MVPFVPREARRILDIGCGAGAFSATIKQERQAEVWGIELNEDASRKASSRIDRVLHAPFDANLALPSSYFDTICFLDVLEHLPDPVAMLQLAAPLLTPAGVIVASIPNFRYFDNVWELVVRKAARYESQGIMDRTHLRIFTQSSIVLLFEEANLTIVKMQGINPKLGSDKFNFFNAITFGWIADMRFQQFAVVARRVAPTNASMQSVSV